MELQDTHSSCAQRMIFAIFFAMDVKYRNARALIVIASRGMLLFYFYQIYRWMQCKIHQTKDIFLLEIGTIYQSKFQFIRLLLVVVPIPFNENK